MRRITLLMTILLAVAAPAQAAVRNVFFAGGQSNAKQVWAEAIASGLQAGYGSSLVMVWTNHSGQALSNWFTTDPKVNYSNDLFTAAGTGVLQAQMQALVDAGDEPVFQGFFWFQGESDTGTNASNYATMDAYTNRFQGMLAQLRSDLELTNDVRFTLAVIDINTNFLEGSSRDLACVDYLRARQTEMSSTPPGSYVDTRGYNRPSDAWHLPTDELTRLGGNMAAAFTNKFGTSLPPEEVTEIISDPADGAIYTTGTFVDQDLICGTAGTPSTTPFNGIAFFQLLSYRVETADLTFTVKTLSGAWADTGAALDVWGLGYTSTPALNKDWLLMADSDTRLLLNGRAPTKIADNLVGAGQSPTAGSVWQLSPAQRTNLAAYVNGLYAAGAQPGDYVVVRVNPDAAIALGGVSVRFGGSGATSPDQRSLLSVTLSDAYATEGFFKFFSNGADGCLNGASVMSAQDLISGTGGAVVDFSGVAFVALPEQTLSDASLALTVQTFSGVMTGANIDLWGLGYQSTPAMSTAWFCTNDVDGRVLLNGRAPVKLADNIVTSGQTVAVGNVWTPNAAQRADMASYLNGLYNLGAKPGDFAVFRMNLDATQAGAYRGVRWGGSHQTNPDRRASISGQMMPATNYLSNPSFEAGTGTAPANWGVAYNNFLGQRTNVSTRSGAYVFRMAVNGDQSGNTANNLNLAQDVYSPDFAGRVVTLSGWSRHDTAEPLISNSVQKVELRLYWLGGTQNNVFITSTDLHNLLPTDLRDAYKPIFISGVVPADATGVRAQVIFRSGTLNSPYPTTGAAIIDDLRLTVFEPIYPPGTQIIVR